MSITRLMNTIRKSILHNLVQRIPKGVPCILLSLYAVSLYGLLKLYDIREVCHVGK